MPRTMLPDGTWKEISWDEIRERSGEDVVRAMRKPRIPRSEMTEGQKLLADRMQAQGELNAALHAAGYKPPKELPPESDDDPACVDDATRQGTRRNSRSGRGRGS